MRLMLSEIAQAVDGKLHGGDAQAIGASIDSRTIKDGDLFFALPGEREEGYRFINDAARKSASGAVTTQLATDAPKDFAQVVVDDVEGSLAKLANMWRKRLSARIVALTGSNGKTTTKEMIASVARQRYKVAATQGNLNNHLGVPLTVLGADTEHECVVIEMGASKKGDIKHLCEIAEPHIGVVLNAGEAHLQGFGDVQTVVSTKGELFENLPEDGVGVVNADSPYCDQWRAMMRAKTVLSFSATHDATASIVERKGDKAALSLQGEKHWFKPHLPGEHNLCNAAAAAAVGCALDIPGKSIAHGLEKTRAVKGRLCLVDGLKNSCLIDDSYNANPTSFNAGLSVVTGMSKEAWVALGDMKELGDNEVALHERAGLETKHAGVKRLFTVGELARHAGTAFGEGAVHFDSIASAAQQIGDELHDGVVLLIKGSRASRMDKLVDALRTPGKSTKEESAC